MALPNTSARLPNLSFKCPSHSCLPSPNNPISPSLLPPPHFPVTTPIAGPSPPYMQLSPPKTPLITTTTTVKKNVLPPPSSTKWAPDSWKTKNALHLPEYPDKEELESVLDIMETYPPLVFAGEVRSPEERLGEAALGRAFLLQGGDCAESFKEFSAVYIGDTFRILLQMSVVLSFGGQLPVIKVGRMAGQFAKPRSDPLEERDGVKLPSYKGDNTMVIASLRNP